MKKNTIIFLALTVLFSIPGISFALSSGSSPVPQPQVQPLPSNQPTPGKPQATPQPSPVRKGPLIPLPQEEKITSIYAAPGIAGVQGGKWVGGDHLSNLTSKLNVVVEIVHPLEVSTTLTEANIFAKVAQILNGAGFTIQANHFTNHSPLPFIHFLIMIQPVENGYAVFLSERVFENVILTRERLKLSNLFQAITWEKQELLFLPANALDVNIMATIERMTSGFASVYKNSQAQVQSQPQR